MQQITSFDQVRDLVAVMFLNTIVLLFLIMRVLMYIFISTSSLISHMSFSLCLYSFLANTLGTIRQGQPLDK